MFAISNADSLWAEDDTQKERDMGQRAAVAPAAVQTNRVEQFNSCISSRGRGREVLSPCTREALCPLPSIPPHRGPRMQANELFIRLPKGKLTLCWRSGRQATRFTSCVLCFQYHSHSHFHSEQRRKAEPDWEARTEVRLRLQLQLWSWKWHLTWFACQVPRPRHSSWHPKWVDCSWFELSWVALGVRIASSRPAALDTRWVFMVAFSLSLIEFHFIWFEAAVDLAFYQLTLLARSSSYRHR